MNRWTFLFLTLVLTFGTAACQDKEPAASTAEQKVEPTTTVFLVRHAEKVLDGSKDPALTEEGKARALRLKEHLKLADIDVILSTDYIRTKETARPLAELINEEIIIYDPKDLTGISDLMTQHKGKTLLISGHSNSTPALVNHLLGKETYENLDESIYDRLYLVTISGESKKATVLSY